MATKSRFSTAQLAVGLVALDALLTAAIIWRVPYTEIDWVAYMQEVKGALSGQLDYAFLRGDTGPLVYPAGFVYIYSVFYWLTDLGENIFAGQCIFWGIYVLTCAVVLAIYLETPKQIPSWTLVLLLLSKRVHSIFVLRLFNDPIAMLFLYLAIYMALKDRWSLATTFLSLGISVKMNVLLFVPGFGLLMVERFGFSKALRYVAWALLIQIVLGAPFLWVNATSYMRGAFDFGRQFFYVWTVNWKFLPEEIFLDRRFAAALLLGHVTTLAVFFFAKWSSEIGLFALLFSHHPSPASPPSFLTPSRMVTIMFTCNFIGVVFARSLHYQFYSWYFHTLPFLFWQTDLPVILRIVMLLIIEACWNIYPSTWWSSGLLQICHLILLVALFLYKPTKSKT